MRPSTGIYCVIPHLSPPRLQAFQTPVARTLQSTSCLQFQNRQLHPRTSTCHPVRKLAPKWTEKNRDCPTVPSSKPRTSSFTTSSIMASDDAYTAFLDKANADLNAGRAPQQGAGSVRTETVDATVQIPAPLQSVDVYYVSDTDELFEPVVLRWEGAMRGVWPSAEQLSSLISPNADLSQAISTLSPSSFDPKNQYASALHAVRAAAVERDSSADQSAVDVKVYRVELSSTKFEYWVLALEGVDGRIVGLRAKAVES